MNLETCIKYLDFVAHECNRHITNRRVSDDELIQLIVEFQHFQKKIAQSKLPHKIQQKVSQIELNYTVKHVERGANFFLFSVLTFGIWSGLIMLRKQRNRQQVLHAIKFDTESLSSFIRLNY